MSVESNEEESTHRGRKLLYGLIGLASLMIVVWIIVRPGIFTIQPIGALPEGITIIYYSRSSEMSLFSSPDSLCLEIQGSVTLLCRAATLGAVDGIAEQIVFRLPYSHWAYLQSTGGMEFN